MIKKQILKSFAVGKYLRLIQTKDSIDENSNRIYKSYNFSKDEVYSSNFYSQPIKFHYLMKDISSINIFENYTPNFINFLKTNIFDNLKSEVYYNKDIMTFDDSKNIIQYNQRCYFLGKNQYQKKKLENPFKSYQRLNIINGVVNNNFLFPSYNCTWTEPKKGEYHYSKEIFFKIKIDEKSYLENGVNIGIFDSNEKCTCLITKITETDEDKFFKGKIKTNIEIAKDFKIKIWVQSTNNIIDIDQKIAFNMNLDNTIGTENAPIEYYLSSIDRSNYSNEFEKYKIYTYTNNEEIRNSLKNYISETYISSYFNNAQIVDNKSIPIYDINYDALDRISFIKFNDKTKIIPFLNKYHLNNLAELILFNSETYQLDDEKFDSILLDNFLNHISNFDIDVKNDIFDELFSLLSMESFTRILNPIGQIKSISNGKYSLTENEYFYSISLGETTKLDEYPINYYTLKNLKSPELYQDYHLFKINDNSSIDAKHYNLENNIISELFRIYKLKVIDKFDEISDKTDIIKYSGKLIKENNLLEDLIQEYKLRYPNFSLNSIRKIFEKFDDGNYHLDDARFEEIYRIYALKHFNELDIKYNRYNFTGNEAFNTLQQLFEDAEKDINAYVQKIYPINVISSFTNQDGNRANIIIKNFKNVFNEILDYVKTTFKSTEQIGIDGINAIKKSLEHSFDNKISNNTYQPFNNLLLSSVIDNDIFKVGIYRNNVESLLSEISNIDNNLFVNFSEEDETYKQNLITNFPTRMINKINDYLSVYNDMFDHENEFKLSGHLHGLRTYDKAIKNTINDLYLTYNYNTTFDNNFIKDNNIDISIEYIDYSKNLLYNSQVISNNDKIKIVNKKFLVFNDFDFSNSNLITFGNYKIYNVDDTYVILFKADAEDIDKIINYLKMLEIVGKLQFSERLKGEHYYKETNYSKSNIISLNVKNSGLSYKLYTFLEVVNLICYENNLSFDENECLFISKINSDEKYSVYEIFKKLSYHKIIEDEKTYFSEIEDDSNIKDINYFNSFKYFKDSENYNETRKKIKQKIQIRKEFNNAIRKSIHRYIPVNTTLWKIKYNDNEISNEIDK